MAKKSYTEIVDLTWSGDTVTRTILGKQIEFSGANETWSKTISLWTDDVVVIIERLLIGGSRGGIRTKQDAWNAWR